MKKEMTKFWLMVHQGLEVNSDRAEYKNHSNYSTALKSKATFLLSEHTIFAGDGSNSKIHQPDFYFPGQIVPMDTESFFGAELSVSAYVQSLHDRGN